MYDIIVIGAGPAGLTAAIYARRAGKSVLVLEKETFGGQITQSPKVENYPGFISLSGNELAEHMVDQMLNLAADAECATVEAIRDKGAVKEVVADGKTYEARAVIIATGNRHRHLGVPGEEEMIGEGISFCAVCDGAFYAGRTVAVIGGGNTALQEAAMLSEICGKVIILQNLPYLTGEGALAEMLSKRENVEIRVSTLVKEFCGNGKLETILVTEDGKESRIPVDGAFVCVGRVPENEPFATVADLDKDGYLIADETCRTKCPGIFVAGDCRTKTVRQITTATADGASAALAAVKYLESFR